MRVLAANNLSSGAGDSGRYDLFAELNRRGAEVVLRPIDASHPLPESLADAAEFDVVVAAGGDGTVSAAAYALREVGTPLFVYPAGTANAVALNLGIQSDPVACADAIFEGAIARVDLGEIVFQGEHRPPGGTERRRSHRPVAPVTSGFVAVAGAGFDARMMERALELKPQFGPGAYLVAALQDATPTMARIELDIDGKRIETKGSGVLFVNFGRIQFDIAVTHDSDAQDGMLEVVVIKARHLVELLPAVISSYLDRIVTHPSRSQVLDTYRGRSVSLTTRPALRVESDGEVLGGTTPVTCRVLPKAARFVVPAHAAVPGVRIEDERDD